MNLNFSLSTIKREARSKKEVERQLLQNGWEEHDSFASDRISYFSNSGVNITVVQAPRGTLVFPSGPLRGRLFGDSVNFFSRQSALGMGAPRGSGAPEKKQDNEAQVKGSRRSGSSFV